ncbi:MAG: enoyl-CoA hydratase-related protein [Desulfuromonadaceae bacterium]|nr:enoyl-CoA hydratase-related protein [Desulfuromonadaceae bacterium]MDD5107784.1 enoyl-CoA hydratase-related protein [Desulfuromonadaceae bacterium]
MRTPVLIDSSLEKHDRIAVMTFQRNDLRNALTGTALIEDILQTLAWVNCVEDVSVLIITGEGSAFSSGGNVREMNEKNGLFSGSVQQIQDQYRRGIQRIPLAMDSAEVPVIAAINGPAIGAGFDLACMCDLRLAANSAVMGETFVNLGIIPGDGGAWFLQRLIGYQRAAELTFTGRIISAQEALNLGILLEVTEPDQLLCRSLELGAQIASKPPRAVRLSKRLLKYAQRGNLPDFLDLCACFQGMAHHTDDHAEAVNAFLEKRPAAYSGK